VLARSEANEGVMDSAAADLELAERSVEIASGAIGKRHWIAEVGIDQSRRISRRQPAIARKTGQPNASRSGLGTTIRPALSMVSFMVPSLSLIKI
jgi:hypothetical protein